MLYDQWPWPLQESESGFTYYVHYLNVLTFSISDLSNILPTWSNIWTGIRQKEYQWNNIAQDNILFWRRGWYFQSFWKLSVVVIEWKLTIEMLNWKLQPNRKTLYFVIMTFYVQCPCPLFICFICCTSSRNIYYPSSVTHLQFTIYIYRIQTLALQHLHYNVMNKWRIYSSGLPCQ